MSIVAASAREYLALRISHLRESVSEIPMEDETKLAVECARIEELEKVLKVLNGGAVPLFDLEVTGNV